MAYDVNKDLRNIGGQPAHDLGVVLSGQESVINHYDGYYERRFGAFAWGPSGPNTLLRWQNVIEPGGNGQIDPGEVVHVGWSTADHSSNVLDMYWTDASGNRIPGSKIYNITTDWTYETAGLLVISFENIFTTEWGEQQPIHIMEVALGMFPQPWPLELLNARNTELNMMLQPLPGGEHIVILPGQRFDLTVPMPIPPGAAVVLRYRVTGPADAAEAIDWVQFVVEPPAVGACCLSTSCDSNLTPEQCAYLGGTFFPGASCDLFICPGEETRCTQGDVNGDGLINAFDIDPFVGVLVGQITDPDYMCSADTNGDGVVTAFDIDPFVALLAGAGNPWFGYEKPCDGNNRVFVANPTAGTSYFVRASKGGVNSDCPVTVEALNASNNVVGARLELQPGDVGDFTVPNMAAKLVYRCHRSPDHTCRFEWQKQ